MKYIILIILIFNTPLFCQWQIGGYYQQNYGNLYENNLSSQARNGIGIIIENYPNLNILYGDISFKADLNFSHKSYCIQSSYVTNFEDNIYQLIIQTAYTYSYYLFHAYGQIGLGIESYKRNVSYIPGTSGIDLANSFSEIYPLVNYGIGIKLEIIDSILFIFEYSNIFLQHNKHGETTINWIEKSIRNKSTVFKIGILLKL